MPPKPIGQPAKPAADLFARRPGMPRFSIEIPAALLRKIERLAKGDRRSRNAQIWALLEEAVETRKKELDE